MFIDIHDTEFDTGSDNSSQNANCAQVYDTNSADDGANADKERDDDGSNRSLHVRKSCRDSACLLPAYHKVIKTKFILHIYT